MALDIPKMVVDLKARNELITDLVDFMGLQYHPGDGQGPDAAVAALRRWLGIQRKMRGESSGALVPQERFPGRYSTGG